MPGDLELVFQRLADMCEDVLAASDAVPVSAYTQESGPYWIIKIDAFNIETESENLEIITWQLSLELILATNTEGWDQEAEKRLQAIIPTVLQYFGRRRQLKRNISDPGLTGLYPRGAQITAGQTNNGSLASGIGQGMITVSFSIDVPMYLETDQVVY